MSMRKDGDWFVLEVPQAGAGTRYRIRIDDDIEIADPASHFQPEDVHGPSEVIDHTYHWRCADWKGRPWSDAVFLETHVGTFTREGTFRAMMARLDHLAATGITAVELMPVSDFPGRWNWGYDGVLLFAPDSSYGRPEDLKALVDAAHARGLMVFLDAVYNHFGPEGNYLGRIAPQTGASRSGAARLRANCRRGRSTQPSETPDGLGHSACDLPRAAHQGFWLRQRSRARGLMVFLDAVYNHFGPEGNYLGRIAPQTGASRSGAARLRANCRRGRSTQPSETPDGLGHSACDLPRAAHQGFWLRQRSRAR